MNGGPATAVFGPLQEEFAAFVKGRRESGDLEKAFAEEFLEKGRGYLAQAASEEPGERRLNLERLYIENYKQLRDPVELFPPEGAIGVVGPNGTGKSTLRVDPVGFFGSKGAGPRFANESIPWSGGATKDPTVVEVTLTTGNGPYTVRRQLKSNTTTAEARDPGGKTVVMGAADVTRWVEEDLLRMDRTTFEATFYAKQKELRFFAHDDGISRVRRISKMLGISGVEVAQQFLRADRNELRSEARVIEARLAEADLESLQSELEEAKAEIQRLEADLEKILTEYEEAEGELKAARETREKLDATYREHTRLTGELREAEGEKRRAEDRAAEAGKDLEELAKASEELGRLGPELEKLPELEAELEKLEEDRRRAERRDAARRELRQAQSRVAAIESEVWDMLEGLDGDEPLPGWSALFELDGPELLEEAVAVLEGAVGELALAEERYEALRELAASHEDFELVEKELREAEGRHEEAVVEVRKISEELEDVSGGEDLEKWERELREEEEKLREVSATHRGRAAAHEREAKNVDRGPRGHRQRGRRSLPHLPPRLRGRGAGGDLRHPAPPGRRPQAPGHQGERGSGEALGGRGGHREEAARGLGEARALARGQRSPGPRRGPRRREARSPQASQGAQARAGGAPRELRGPDRRGSCAGPRPLRGAPLSARRPPRRCESGQGTRRQDQARRGALEGAGGPGRRLLRPRRPPGEEAGEGPAGRVEGTSRGAGAPSRIPA